MPSPNGEYAFTLAGLPWVLAELEAAGCAVPGGEVWLLEAGGPGLIAGADGELQVYSWTTENRRHGEPWPAYVARCAAESLDAAVGLAPEADPPPERAGSVRYDLTFQTAG